jgi:hypothetical protein
MPRSGFLEYCPHLARLRLVLTVPIQTQRRLQYPAVATRQPTNPALMLPKPRALPLAGLALNQFCGDLLRLGRTPKAWREPSHSNLCAPAMSMLLPRTVDLTLPFDAFNSLAEECALEGHRSISHMYPIHRVRKAPRY